jgi:hypothetical protein
MPDERLDSMRQGIAPAPESPEAQHADAGRRQDNLAHPLEMESAMGGTSDAEGAGDQADMESDLHVGLPDDRTAGGAEGSG